MTYRDCVNSGKKVKKAELCVTSKVADRTSVWLPDFMLSQGNCPGASETVLGKLNCPGQVELSTPPV